MSRKASCDSTEYTKGFKITHTQDGWFIATKDKTTLKARTADEINKMIQNQKEE